MHFSALGKCGKDDRGLCAAAYTHNTSAERHWMGCPTYTLLNKSIIVLSLRLDLEEDFLFFLEFATVLARR